MNNKVVSKSVLMWSVLISTLVVVASLFGLFDPSIYGKETENWATQAKGQDIGNLLAVVVLIVSGYLLRKGSFKAGLLWLGTLLYLIYAYVVYAMAVHFNALFLVYVAVLGLCSYAVILTISDMKRQNIECGNVSALRFASYVIIGIGILFGMLWLSEIIPALLTDRVPQSLLDAGLWVNPIHVIDLAIVLPGFMLTGYFALKGRSSGLFFLAPWLTFSVLMGLSIVAAMIMMTLQGVGSTLAPMIMVSLVVLLSFVALWRYTNSIVHVRK